MKIFSIKSLLGMAALYGATQYARKNGGFRQAATGLLDKVRQAADQQRRGQGIGAARSTSGASVGEPGYGSSYGSPVGSSVGSSEVGSSGFSGENSGYGGFNPGGNRRS
jgi:hypothetical protein